MKAVELKDLSLEELKKRLADEQESLANLRFQLATSQLDSPIKVRTVRRDIARLETLIRQRKIAAPAPAPAPVKPKAATKKTEPVSNEVKQS
jgi:large subunit ribosomal protein L29